MKICHIITTVDFGGAERLLLYLAQEQSVKNEIHIIYLKDKNPMQSLFPDNVKFYHVGLDRHSSKKIYDIVRTLKPDVVHTHLGHADWLGLWATRNLPVKKVCTIHNIWYKWNWTDYVIFFIYRFIFATIASDCTVISITKAIDEHIKKRFGVPDNRRILLYNTVPDLTNSNTYSRLQARQKLNLNLDTFYVLFVGRFEKQKSVRTLIDAFNIIIKIKPQIKLLLVGDGTLRHDLEEQVKHLNLSPNITFVGKQQQPEIYMQAANVLALPSIFEGLPLVVLEAFRANLPIVTTNLENLKEVIDEEYNGFLFEPENSEELAKCILKFAENPLLQKQMSQNARDTFIKKYDIKKYVTRLEEIYESK